MEELISVIVPIYNVEKYLTRCIESIAQQSYRNLEIILVDDGSTDSSGSICDAYQSQDSRIITIHKENGGLSDARNAGIEIAKGNYLAFIDSDDYIDLYMIEKLYKSIRMEKAELAMCGFQAVDDEENYLDSMTSKGLRDGCYTKRDIFDLSYQAEGWNVIVAWNKLYHKDLFGNVQYPKGKIHEDEFIFHHIIDQCEKIVITAERLYYYRQRANSITTEDYSIKRLDAVEAKLLRCKYYQSEKMWKSFFCTEKLAFYWLGVGLKKLSYSEAEDRFREIQKLYREILITAIENCRFSIKWLDRFFFCIAPGLYCNCVKILLKYKGV